jgi:predicted SAM-dependent methyltransferase
METSPRTVARALLERLPFGPKALELYGDHLRSRERERVREQKARFLPDPCARKINLGAGYWYRPYWENIDLYTDDAFVDYKTDLRSLQRFPLEDGCAELLFTSHCLEHLSDEAALHALHESCRILKPGAVMRILVPDLEKAFAAYRAGDAGFFSAGDITLVGESAERRLVNFFASYRKDGYSGGPVVDDAEVAGRFAALDRYDFVSWCVSLIPGDAPYKAHVNGYDFEKLAGMLKQAGFGAVEKSGFRRSRIPELRGEEFDNRPTASLFVEAVK